MRNLKTTLEASQPVSVPDCRTHRTSCKDNGGRHVPGTAPAERGSRGPFCREAGLRVLQSGHPACSHLALDPSLATPSFSRLLKGWFSLRLGCNKAHTWSLSPVPGTELLKPSDPRVGIFSSTPNLLGRERGWRLSQTCG